MSDRQLREETDEDGNFIRSYWFIPKLGGIVSVGKRKHASITIKGREKHQFEHVSGIPMTAEEEQEFIDAWEEANKPISSGEQS